MNSNASFWQRFNGLETIDAVLDLASGPIHQPQSVDGELYSSSFVLPRGFLGVAGQLAVSEASCVVVRGRNGFCRTFGPGVHSLRLCPPGRLEGWLVDLSQHSRLINLDNLYTSDPAKVSLQVDVEFKVVDPQAVIQIKSPLQTLTQIVTGTIRQVIENLPHRSLFGGTNSTQLVSIATLERQIRQSLHAEVALEGLHVLSLRIVKVEGDSDYLALATKEALAEQQLLAEKAALLTRRKLVDSERELILFQAETERLATSTKEQTALDEAKRQADIFKLESTQREFQREMEQMRLAHKQTLARIEALRQAVTALGDPRHLIVANGPYAVPGNNTNGREQILTKMVDHLTEPQAVRAPTSSNGHSKPTGECEKSTIAE